MKKLLLSASMMMLAGASAFAVTDGQTYPEVNGFNCENLWVLDRFHTESDYLASKIAATSARTATTDGTTVYVGLSGETATIEKFDLKTGAYLGSLAVTKGGEALSGTLAVNQVGFDDYGHFYAATFAPNTAGDGQYNMYQIDLTTGEATLVGDLLFDGGIGRVDYSDVVGDITGKEAACTVMAAASAADNLNVYKWVREKGSDDWMGGWTDQATYQAIKAGDTCPNTITGFGAGAVLKIVRDDQTKEGQVNMFYIDGFTSLPALYGSDGAMIDNLNNADLKKTNKETGETTGSIPEPALGANGIAEGHVGDANLMIYPEGQYDSPHSCQAVVTTVDDEMSFESMDYLWMVPANGFGQTSDSGTRVHSLFCLSQDDGSALLLSFKCFNGMGVYKITKGGDSVESNVAAAANITVNGDVIAVSEVAETIEVFNLAGQKVAEARNASEVAAPATGAYIVKAVVAGAPVVKKVIL